MKVRPNFIDRIVGWASPSAGYKRLQYRKALNLFEGADRGRRTKHWRAPDSSIQADTRRGLRLLRARARDLAQNNAYAASAHREIPANIIGTGIRPQVRSEDPDVRAEHDRFIADWFETTACDVRGELNFYGLQQQIARSVVEAGECLVVRKRRMAGVEQIPLQIDVLEPDHIDTDKDGIVSPNGRNVIIQGVEYSPRGRRVAYWLFDHHPGDQFYRMTQLMSRRVPASEVLHIRRIERPGQVRGVPWAAPVLMRLRDFDDYADAQLTRQKIAACFSVFITPGDQFGGVLDTNSDAGAEEPLLPERVEPGMIEELREGKDVKFGNPPGAPGYGDYSTVTLHEIAAGYGVPYSVLTGDLRQVNFSSGRMGDRAFNRNVRQWQQHIFITQLCQPVWAWFMEALETMGRIDERMPARWTAPRRELTDPAREIPAIRDSVRAGLITHAEAIREQGYDPDDFLNEAAEHNRQIDDRGLVFDSDPRKVSGAGLTQARPPGTEIPSPEVSDGTEEPEE